MARVFTARALRRSAVEPGDVMAESEALWDVLRQSADPFVVAALRNLVETGDKTPPERRVCIRWSFCWL